MERFEFARRFAVCHRNNDTATDLLEELVECSDRELSLTQHPEGVVQVKGPTWSVFFENGRGFAEVEGCDDTTLTRDELQTVTLEVAGLLDW